jgi:putative transcriptional regulator
MTPEQLKAIRTKYSLKTKNLAEICGVSVRTVENWEQGRRSPSKPAMKLLKSWLKDKQMFEE